MLFSAENMMNALQRIADNLIEAKEVLTYIDNLCGDGDLGISMEKAGYSILEELQAGPGSGISSLLMRCAQRINRNAPSTMGTLMSLSTMEAARVLMGKETIEDADLLLIPRRMIETIMINGRAQLGDKTVLDALIPYADALQTEYLMCFDIEKAALTAAKTAEFTANDTKGKLAKIGRAKWIAERSKNCPDGGAMVCAIVVNSIVNEATTIKL